MMPRLLKFFDTVSLIATFALLMIVAFNIIARQIHDLSHASISFMLPGAIELSRYALLIIVFMALPRASSRGMVRVDVISNLFPNAFRHFLEALWLSLMAGFTTVLAWLFINKAWLMFNRGDATQDLLMPLFIFYLLVAIASIATTLTCLGSIITKSLNA